MNICNQFPIKIIISKEKRQSLCLLISQNDLKHFNSYQNKFINSVIQYKHVVISYSFEFVLLSDKNLRPLIKDVPILSMEISLRDKTRQLME